MTFKPTFEALLGAYKFLVGVNSAPAFGLETRSEIEGTGATVSATINQKIASALLIIFQYVTPSNEERDRYVGLYSFFAGTSHFSPVSSLIFTARVSGDQGCRERAWDEAFQKQLSMLLSDLKNGVIDPELMFQKIVQDAASTSKGKRENL